MNQEQNQKTLLTQGSLWAAFDGFTAVFLAAYAIALGASNTVVGLLAAIPFIAFLLTQIPGVTLSQHFSRTKLYLAISTTDRLSWIGILLAPFITTHPIPLLIIFYLFGRICVGLHSPAINTLLADVVEHKKRGAFFSKRFKLISIFGMIAVFFGGIWLKQWPKDSPDGFAIMFAVGTALGLLSSLIIIRIKEPEYKDHDHHTIKEFFTPAGDLKKFIAYSIFYSFAYMIASPLITVFILKNLDAGYHWFAILAGTTTLAKVISATKIGKLTDKFGDKPLTLLGIFGTSIVPLSLIIVTPSTLWLIIPIAVISGISWAAVDIAKFNMLLGLTTPEKEGMQIAEYNFYNSIPLAIAPWVGGLISENVIFIAGVPFVFAISAALRFISAFLFMRVKEPRSKKEYSATYVFKHALHIDAHKGLTHSLHPIKRISRQNYK